jgi:hypothetical protein
MAIQYKSAHVDIRKSVNGEGEQAETEREK